MQPEKKEHKNAFKNDLTFMKTVQKTDVDAAVDRKSARVVKRFADEGLNYLERRERHNWSE